MLGSSESPPPEEGSTGTSHEQRAGTSRERKEAEEPEGPSDSDDLAALLHDLLRRAEILGREVLLQAQVEADRAREAVRRKGEGLALALLAGLFGLAATILAAGLLVRGFAGLGRALVAEPWAGDLLGVLLLAVLFVGGFKAQSKLGEWRRVRRARQKYGDPREPLGSNGAAQRSAASPAHEEEAP